MELRSQLTDLLTVKNHSSQPEAVSDDEMVSVSAATQRVAFAYERFRNTLEPDEEDILRRRSIFRILKRRLQEDDRPAEVTAVQLLQELIRGHYISPVPRSFAEALAQRITRARLVVSGLRPELASWFINLVAVAIDQDIFPRQQEEALVQLMYQDTWTRTEWIDNLVAPKDRPIQLYIGCHRALFEADDYEIALHYFSRHYESWDTADFSEADARKIQADLPNFYRNIQRSLQHPSRERIVRLLRPVAVPYRVTRDVLSEQTSFADSDELAGATRGAVEKRTQNVRRRMSRRAWNSILFLFFTKTILAGIIEVPYELLVFSKIHVPALIVNIFFHPFLLFVAATTARVPGARNADMIVDQVKVIVTGEGELPTVVMRRLRQYGAATWAFFALIYAVLFLFLFWGVFAVLGLLEFSIVAMFMFLMFLGLVTFLAARIRRGAVDIRVVDRQEGALSGLISFLALPIIEFGRYLALQVSKINVPLILMDRVLEAPFKIFIDVLEEWFGFIRDRREEIV